MQFASNIYGRMLQCISFLQYVELDVIAIRTNILAIFLDLGTSPGIFVFLITFYYDSMICVCAVFFGSLKADLYPNRQAGTPQCNSGMENYNVCNIMYVPNTDV